MRKHERWLQLCRLAWVTSGASIVFLTSCGGCEGVGNFGDVRNQPAIAITLSDSDGASVADADVVCQLTGFPTTELLMLSPGDYHCGDRPGLYALRITWHGGITSRSVAVASMDACDHPMTVRLALVLSPADPDAGLPIDGSAAQDGGNVDSGNPVDAARD